MTEDWSLSVEDSAVATTEMRQGHRCVTLEFTMAGEAGPVEDVSFQIAGDVPDCLPTTVCVFDTVAAPAPEPETAERAPGAGVLRNAQSNCRVSHVTVCFDSANVTVHCI